MQYSIVAAGCPLDYLKNLPRTSGAYRTRLRVQELGGYLESRVFDDSPTAGARYLIGVRLGTDLPGGVIISDWDFCPPWENHSVCWDYDPQDIVPADEYARYASVFNSRLSAVLNERRLLLRGRPVEGLLCGRAVHSIPESIAKGAAVRAQLMMVDDTGYTVRLDIELAVHHRTPQINKASRSGRRVRIFDKPDLVPR